MKNRAAGFAIASLWALGCASPPQQPAPAPSEVVAANSSMASGAVSMQLTFGAEADLDLYVTGPRQETVYFANTPSKIGGSLDEDQRCDADAPRTETVTFSAPVDGRYRIGIDYPKPCGGSREPVAFTVVVLAGDWRHVTRGQIRPGHFLSKVLEVDWLDISGSH